MKEVFQTRYGQGTGNCFAACVASIFEISIKEVPHFVFDHGDEFMNKFVEWLKPKGLSALSIPFQDAVEAHWFFFGYQIACVQTENGFHAVVMKDLQPIFDPAPGSGYPKEYKSIEYIVVFTVADPRRVQ